MKKSFAIAAAAAVLVYVLSLQSCGSADTKSEVPEMSSREAVAQDHNRAGGVHYVYPEDRTGTVTKAPAGYKPFFIYEFGRHGSRYLAGTKVDSTRRAYKLLQKGEKEGMLTARGKELLSSFNEFYAVHDGWEESLTPLGVKQQRGIAERMFRNYPEVFRGRAEIDARATYYPRVILTMTAFCERLKELNPKLEITKTAGQARDKEKDYGAKRNPRKMAEIKARKIWAVEGNAFIEENVNVRDFAARFFTSADYAEDPLSFMQGVFYAAGVVQDMEMDLDLYSFFTEDEIYALWVSDNYQNYCKQAAHPDLRPYWAKTSSVLRGIIEYGDAAIAGDRRAAILRFGHDANVGPLASAMHLSGAECTARSIREAAESWRNFDILPMSCNIQMVFFRNRKGDVIVKTSLNEIERTMPLESDIAPFYRWNDVKAMLEKEASDLQADL